MKFMESGFYRFSGLGMGEIASGITPNIGISLTGKAAKEFYNNELNDRGYQNLQETGIQQIFLTGISSNIEDIDPPFHFVRNKDGNRTWLLRWNKVPGNSCELGIDGNSLEVLQAAFEGKKEVPKWIVYSPHNVDNIQQAYALASTWVEWANVAEAVVSDK